jgi:hypothetical protein
VDLHGAGAELTMAATGCEEFPRADRIQPLESLADWSARTKAQEAAAKVVNLADARARLRPAAAIAER